MPVPQEAFGCQRKGSYVDRAIVYSFLTLDCHMTILYVWNVKCKARQSDGVWLKITELSVPTYLKLPTSFLGWSRQKMLLTIHNKIESELFACLEI